MLLSALFGAKQTSDFEDFLVCLHGKRRGMLSRADILWTREEGVLIFRNFMRTSFMDDP